MPITSLPMWFWLFALGAAIGIVEACWVVPFSVPLW
jgi:hypothetical protein